MFKLRHLLLPSPDQLYTLHHINVAVPEQLLSYISYTRYQIPSPTYPSAKAQLFSLRHLYLSKTTFQIKLPIHVTTRAAIRTTSPVPAKTRATIRITLPIPVTSGPNVHITSLIPVIATSPLPVNTRQSVKITSPKSVTTKNLHLI